MLAALTPQGKLLGAMAASLLVGAFAGSHLASHEQPMASSSLGDVQELAQIIAKPKRDQCSSVKEDCSGTGCCDIVGCPMLGNQRVLCTLRHGGQYG